MVLGAALCGACGASVEPQGLLIRAGSVEGAKAIEPDVLTAGLAQHPPEGWLFRTYARYDPLQLSLDRQRIRSFYEERGFYSAKVLETRVDSFEDGVRVDFIVEEGPPYVLRALHIADSATVSVDAKSIAVREAVAQGLIVDNTFVYARFAATKAAIRKALASRGHAHASVDGRVEVFTPDAAVEVEIEIEPGPIVQFGRIDIEAGPLPVDSIRARLSFRTGDRFDAALLSQTEGRLYELGMVGAVSFYLPRDGPSDVQDVRIEIKPGERNELRLGLGIARQNPNYQMRLRTGYVRRDFFDPLASVSTEIRPALLYRPGDAEFSFGLEWRAGLTREDFLLPRLTATAEVQYSLIPYEAYSTLGPTIRLLLSRPFISDRLRISLAANLSLLGFPRVDGSIPPAQFASIGLPACTADCVASGTPSGLTIAYIEPALTYDGRDDPIDPTRGGYIRLQLELGRTLNAPGLSWLKLTPDLRGYLALGTRRLVLAARARLGAKLIPGSPLPATQRYFGGGAESQRGFTVRQLSPFFGEGNASVPVGGESLFELSAELRSRILKVFGMWLGLVAFVDAADVGVDFADLEPVAPHVATGSGLRLYTPIGPVRLDVGYRLNRVQPGVEPGGSDRLAFHLSLGEAY